MEVDILNSGRFADLYKTDLINEGDIQLIDWDINVINKKRVKM